MERKEGAQKGEGGGEKENGLFGLGWGEDGQRTDEPDQIYLPLIKSGNKRVFFLGGGWEKGKKAGSE